jgi:hypothetical protein
LRSGDHFAFPGHLPGQGKISIIGVAFIFSIGEAKVNRLKLSPLRLFALAFAGMIAVAGFTAFIGIRRHDFPDVAVLQRAYDREADNGTPGHDANLHVIDALCNRRRQLGLFLCVVAFTDRRDPDRQLYYDIAEVAAEGGKWQLKSGLCKH